MSEEKINKEKHQIIKLKKKYFSHKKLHYSNNKDFIKSPIYKSNKLLFDENNTNRNIFKYININNNDFKYSSNPEENLKIYKNIKRKIKDFIENNYNNTKLLFSSLNYIYSFINSFFSSLSKIIDKNQENNDEENDKQKSKDILLDNNPIVLYELKIDELNKKINDLNHEIKILTMNNENTKSHQAPKILGENHLLKKKILELESKIKLNEFKYLLCIKEQQTKIADLEKELKIKKIKEDYKEIKETRCFPHLIQYNYKDDINPKSIPLTKSIFKNLKSNKKKKINENENENKINSIKKNSFLTITNSNNNNNNNNNNNIFNRKNNHFKTNYNTKSYKKIKIKNDDEDEDYCLNPKNINSEKVMIKYFDYFTQNNIEEEDEINNNNNDYSSRIKQISYRYEDDDKNLKVFSPKNIINKEKKYYISHPNLNIAGVNNKKNKYSNGLPNKIFSFKFSKNLEKNAFFTFPSTLNETLVNLEKLRINKNYIDKDDII